MVRRDHGGAFHDGLSSTVVLGLRTKKYATPAKNSALPDKDSNIRADRLLYMPNINASI